MKLTAVFTATFLLLALNANSIAYSNSENINLFESSGAAFASGETMFYNFTSDHLLVDDEGDWISSGYDIRRTYVACDGQYIYILWVTQLTSSHVYEIYFDVGEENGYSIGLIKATYLFSSFKGFLRWDGASWQSATGEVAKNVRSDTEEKQEYREIKISLSTLGYPQVVKLIHRIDGQDQAPDDSFILIYSNQSRARVFAASFYAKTSDFDGRPQETKKESIGYYRSEGFNASLKVVNFGNSTLEPLDVSLNLPEGSGTNLNESSWLISIEPNESWNLQFKLRPERLSKLKLTADISSKGSESTFSQTIPLDLFVIPEMDLSIQHPEEMRAGFANELNITIVNHEAMNVEVSVDTYGWSYIKEIWYFYSPTLELGPNSSVKVVTKIVPLAIINPEYATNYSFLEMALDFENVPICSSAEGRIKIVEPKTRISLQYPKEVILGETFHVNISAINDEDKEIMAFFDVWTKASGVAYSPKEQKYVSVLVLDDSKHKEQITSISPRSNITFSFKFKAMKEDLWGNTIRDARVEFSVRRGIHSDAYLASIKVVSLFTKLWPTMQFTLILVFLAMIVGLALFYWKKRSRNWHDS